jgi:predicted ribosomally synthesized peptide with SipW-like signal peptide
MNEHNDLRDQDNEDAEAVETDAAPVNDQAGDEPQPPEDRADDDETTDEPDYEQDDVTAGEAVAAADEATAGEVVEEAVTEDAAESLDDAPYLAALPDDYDHGEFIVPGRDNLEEDLDIDEALASVASLSDVIAEREALEAAEEARREEAARAAEEAAQRRAAYFLPRPALIRLQRGQLASIVPALLLIIIGSWLTFALTLSDTPPDAGIIVPVVMGGLSLLMLTYWLTSGRWAQGTLFIGLAILLSGGTIAYLTQTETFGPEGWPLVIVALGAAITFSTLLSRSGSGSQALAGLIMIVAGLATLSVTTGMIEDELLDAAASVAPGVLIGAAALILLPALVMLIRRRG